MRVVTKFVLFAVLIVFGLMAFCGNQDVRPGRDVAKVLRQAAEGGPVRVVAFGGSITLGGAGWIREWLATTFPKSAVFIQNAGLGGTGSDLGLFRLDRDVIAYQPNLVFIEFSVNDSGLTDEEAVRNLESMIVRLRNQPDPPAIVFLIAAQQSKGLAKERIRRLASHYEILVIDLDEALHRHVEEKALPWSDFMTDAVHPNALGHAFYAATIAERLSPLRAINTAECPARPLPPPLSERPLLLEASMMPLISDSGWVSEDTMAGRAFRSFPGLISASDSGSSISVPFSGTRVGLFFPLSSGFGTFYASVDGDAPQQIIENTYEGYGYQILKDDLTPGPHVLNIVLPPPEPGTKSFQVNGPVKFGSVLVAGARSAAVAHSTSQAVGPYTTEVLAKLRFQEIPPVAIGWIGPFTDGKDRNRANVGVAYPPESLALKGQFPGQDGAIAGTDHRWSALTGESSPIVDLAAFAPNEQSPVFYLATEVTSPAAGSALLRFSIKGRRQIWVNGHPVSLDQPDSDSDTLTIVPVKLQAGANTILWKIGSVKRACTFSAGLALPWGGPLDFKSPLGL